MLGLTYWEWGNGKYGDIERFALLLYGTCTYDVIRQYGHALFIMMKFLISCLPSLETDLHFGSVTRSNNYA